MVMLGAMLTSDFAVSREAIVSALPEVLEAAGPEVLARNEQALDVGRSVPLP